MKTEEPPGEEGGSEWRARAPWATARGKKRGDDPRTLNKARVYRYLAGFQNIQKPVLKLLLNI